MMATLPPIGGVLDGLVDDALAAPVDLAEDFVAWEGVGAGEVTGEHAGSGAALGGGLLDGVGDEVFERARAGAGLGPIAGPVAGPVAGGAWAACGLCGLVVCHV